MASLLININDFIDTFLASYSSIQSYLTFHRLMFLYGNMFSNCQIVLRLEQSFLYEELFALSVLRLMTRLDYNIN